MWQTRKKKKKEHQIKYKTASILEKEPTADIFLEASWNEISLHNISFIE